MKLGGIDEMDTSGQFHQRTIHVSLAIRGGYVPEKV